MPKPATTHPTSRIATAPKRQPIAASKMTTASKASQLLDDPIEGTAAERAVPSAIRRALVPAPQLLLRSFQVWLADGEPHLRSPYRRARAPVGGGDGDRKPGPERVEVKEERDRQAEVCGEQCTPGSWEVSGDICDHERQREDHENQAAEHVVQEKPPADMRPRQVLADEPEQDHGGGEAPVPDDEVRQRDDAR